MKALIRSSTALALLASGAALAAPDLGQATKQATNWTAISMFAVFVVLTLFITKWAAAKTRRHDSAGLRHSGSGPLRSGGHQSRWGGADGGRNGEAGGERRGDREHVPDRSASE